MHLQQIDVLRFLAITATNTMGNMLLGFGKGKSELVLPCLGAFAARRRSSVPCTLTGVTPLPCTLPGVMRVL